MRRLGLGIVTFVVLVAMTGMTGCMISTQEGEKTHVNAADPDQIVFHFDTPFNRALLYGRSMVLVGLALWLVKTRRSGGGNVITILLALGLGAGAVGLYVAGNRKVSHYRIELNPVGLALNLPAQPTKQIDWNSVEAIDGEGEATDVSFGGKQAMWSTEWDSFTIHLRGDEKVHVDLKPLSYEQRGTLWRAVARFAELEVHTWVEQTRN